MRLAIVGSRTFNDYDLLVNWVRPFKHYTSTSITIISGGASGADALAKKYAEHPLCFNTEYIEFPAEWNKYGKSAGFIRNQQIIDNCDMVLAFWNGESRGTADTIEKAKRAKKPTFIVYY